MVRNSVHKMIDDCRGTAAVHRDAKPGTLVGTRRIDSGRTHRSRSPKSSSSSLLLEVDAASALSPPIASSLSLREPAQGEGKGCDLRNLG